MNIVEGRCCPLSTGSQGICKTMVPLLVWDISEMRDRQCRSVFCAHFARQITVSPGLCICSWKCAVSQLVAGKAKLSEVSRIQLTPGLFLITAIFRPFFILFIYNTALISGFMDASIHGENERISILFPSLSISPLSSDFFNPPNCPICS